MSTRKARIAGVLGIALWASSARAQIPSGVPAGVGVPPSAGSAVAVASPGGVAAVAAPAAAPKTLFGFFGITKANCQACKAKLCQSQIGQALNGMIAGPIGGISGGFIPPLCPPAPSAAAVAAMAAVDPAGPGGAKVVAAKIQQSEADAKARVVAVEYLGTVDCSHWPEASKALKNALRNDPNECVRFAAARALNSGCCCSKEMIDALRLTVAGEDTDGGAPETSARVKAAAFSALQNCLMRVPEALPAEVPPPPPPPPAREPGAPTPAPIPAPLREVPTGPTATSASASAGVDPEARATAARFATDPRPPAYQDRLRRKTYGQTVDEARRTLFRVAETPQAVPLLPPGKQDVFHALVKARQGLPAAPRVNPPAVPTDPAVRSTSYAPESVDGPPAAQAPPATGRRPSAAPAGSTESMANRGLFGLIFKPRPRPTSGE